MQIGPFKIFKEVKKSELDKELGESGTTIFNGQISDEDYVSDLIGDTALDTYNKMRKSDGVVKAALLACELPIRAANWYIAPASEDEQDKEVADFISHNLFEAMSITWDDFLRQALLCLPFGFSVFEKVFKPVSFNNKEMIGWKKFSPRLQPTIFQWQTEAGEDGITQQLPTGKKVSIPIEKLLIFTYQKEGDNWLGTSLLRSAYRPWFFKSHIEKVNAIAFERQGVGIPYGILPKDATTGDRNKMEELLRNIRANEQGFLIQPEDWEIEFKDMKSGTVKDPDETVRRYNREILTSVLAQFLDLGSGATGSRALSTDHSSIFHNSLAAVAKMVQDIINKYAIKQLVDLNYTVSDYPTLEYSYIGLPRYGEIAESLSKLIQQGAIVNDKGLEEHLRQLMDLPPKPEEEETEVEETPKEEPEEEKASEKKTFSEFTPWRKLTFAEKKVRLPEVNREMDTATNRLRIDLDKILKKSVNDLIRQFELVLEAPSNKEKRERIKKINVKYQKEYRKVLYNSILNMFQYGKMIAAHEMKKEIPPTPSNSLQIMSETADQLTEIMAEDLIKEGKLTLLNELQKKQFTFSESLNNVIKGLRSREKSIVLNAAALNVSSAINQGRRASFVAYKDDIYALQRSEILDQVTCNYCMSIDGRVFRKNDPFTKVDAIHSSCRGLWVEIMKDEEVKPPIKGIPKTLRDRFRDVNNFKQLKNPIVKKDSLAGKFIEKKKVSKELDIVYSKATEAKKEIDLMIDSVAAKHKGAIALKAPLKGKERAVEKVINELNGNASRLTDIARNTVLVRDSKQLQSVFKKIKKNPNVVKAINVEDVKMGYNGAMIKARTSNGMIGETQIVTEKMFYAKDNPTLVKDVLGPKKFQESFSEIKKSVGGLEGGLGHKYYEQWRVMPKENMGFQIKNLERLSRDYYANFK